MIKSHLLYQLSYAAKWGGDYAVRGALREARSAGGAGSAAQRVDLVGGERSEGLALPAPAESGAASQIHTRTGCPIEAFTKGQTDTVRWSARTLAAC